MQVAVQAYVAGHGMFLASLTSVLRTASIIEKAFQPPAGEQGYPWPVRATLETHMVRTGFATERAPDVRPGYLYDHETEEECLVLLASFHPHNKEGHNLQDVQAFEAWIQEIAEEVAGDEQALEEHMRHAP